MKRYVVYDFTGRIIRSGSCQDHMIEAQAAPGEHVMEGKGRDDRDEVVDGVIMSKEAAAKVRQRQDDPKVLPDGL